LGVRMVGASAAGLALAGELATRGPVTVVDRLPAVGGVLGYEHPSIRALAAAAPGVARLLATTVLRWRGDAGLVAGPDGIRWLSARRLVYAGGTRPATRAELGIAGPRPAGVLSATVALHLLEAGVLLGRRVAVLGGGHWARTVGALLAAQPCETIAVTPAGEPAFDGAGEHLAGWRATALDGVARVTAVTLASEDGAPDGAALRIPCDAVVLAAPGRPLRNVDGAVLPGSAGVTFVQPDGANMSVDAVVAAARAAAAELLAPSEPSPRVLEV
jgi:D-hydroxyproline dehydrogenase subunit alpha